MVKASVSVGARTRVPDAASSRLVPHPLGAMVSQLDVRRRSLREDSFVYRQCGFRRRRDPLLSLLFRLGGRRPALAVFERASPRGPRSESLRQHWMVCGTLSSTVARRPRHDVQCRGLRGRSAVGGSYILPRAPDGSRVDSRSLKNATPTRLSSGASPVSLRPRLPFATLEPSPFLRFALPVVPPD